MRNMTANKPVTPEQLALRAGDGVIQTLDDGSTKPRLVRCPPSTLTDGTPIVWLHGVKGCVALCRCEPVKPKPRTK